MTDPRKPIFDAVRTMLDRGLTSAEVVILDDVLDDAGVAEAPELAPVPPRWIDTRRTGPAGIALLHSFEGCARKLPDGRFQAYPDPGTGGAPWTIGWGSTYGPDGKPIRPGTIWTKAECDEHFARSLERYERDVIRAIGDAPTSQAQFDALVSFHYNTGAIGRATLTRQHRAGAHRAAADEFLRWNRAGGRVLRGLTRRRQAERKLYLEGN